MGLNMDKKITYPENIDQAKALAQFLVNEAARHEEDIDAIWDDLLELVVQWRIHLPEPNHEFMRVR